MTLPNDKWREIRPCYYERREYSPEQIDALSRRPTEMINEVLRKSRKLSPILHEESGNG